ncbi:MAG: TetR/AcrR family transcriptional regulator [Chloroflexaceae bacterium]|nr:TetR/AcrR family transcriptional regulator [Chloroflexaceae bacterium]
MPRPDMRAERIPQILDAALLVFARSGFDQTRMEDIAEQAGLSKATIYLYFSSKDELILALLKRFFDQSFEALTALQTAEGPVAVRLLEWTRQRMAEMQAQAAFLSIGFEFHALAARQETSRQLVRQSYAQYRRGIAALIQQGVEQGELQAINVEELAVAIISIYEGLTVLWMLEPGTVDVVGVAEQAVRALLVCYGRDN